MNRFYRWRFGVVLLAALLLAVVQPIAFGSAEDRDSFDTFFSLLVVAVLLSFLEKRLHRIAAVGFATLALLATWSSHATGGQTSDVLLAVGYLAAACFFAYALYGILHRVFTKRLSGHAIFGAICGYLLLGIIWGLLYATLDILWPDSFLINEMHRGSLEDPCRCRGIFSYYSFVTLTTLGYGDVTPVTPAARTLAWLEALVGQVYLAVLVAGLVGMQVARTSRGNTHNE